MNVSAVPLAIFLILQKYADPSSNVQSSKPSVQQHSRQSKRVEQDGILVGHGPNRRLMTLTVT